MRSGNRGFKSSISNRCSGNEPALLSRSGKDRERAAEIEPNRECVLGLFQWHLRSLSNYFGNGNRRTQKEQ